MPVHARPTPLRPIHSAARSARRLVAALLPGLLAGALAVDAVLAQSAPARKADKAARTLDDAPAGAASAAGVRPPAASLPVMTRNELRACLKQRTELQAQRDAMLNDQRARDDEKVSIQAEAEALKQALAALDRTNAEAVNAYNARAEANDQRVDRYNAGNPDFNARVAAFDQRRTAYAQTCAGRRYNEDDQIVIEAGR